MLKIIVGNHGFNLKKFKIIIINYGFDDDTLVSIFFFKKKCIILGEIKLSWVIDGCMAKR